MVDADKLASPDAEVRHGALRAAFARGTHYMSDEMAAPENLTVTLAAQKLGLPAVELLKQCRAGQYYLLEREAENLRFPYWQVGADQEGLRMFIREFRLANRGCWAMHGYAARANSHLGGKPLKDYLVGSHVDMAQLEHALRIYLDAGPGQGAL